MSTPKDVMSDVRTTAHNEDHLGEMLREIQAILGADGYQLIAIVANHSDGVVVLRAPGVPFRFSEVMMRAFEQSGFMREEA